MTEEEYFANRLDDQIGWYDRKSVWNQKRYKLLKYAELIISASIPVAISFAEHWWVRLGIGIGGGAIAVITGIHGICNYHENWLRYRATCEALKREKYLYATRTGPYADCREPFRRLVETAESIMAQETVAWVEAYKGRAVHGHEAAVRDSASSSIGS